MQFRDICRLFRRNEPDMLRLDVTPNKERVSKELDRLKAVRADMERRMNEPPPEQRRTTEGFAGWFTPIPDHILPPGMRKDAE
jgi:hypothetical protein